VRGWLIRSLEKRAPGIWDGVLCRKCYIDEKLVESVGSVAAVVNLGAGFDTRLYRLPALDGLPAWEVDQPRNIEEKLAGLRRVFGGVPANVTLVPVDFDTADLGESLAAAGYSSEARTFFILEAVTQYVSEAGMAATFGFLAKAAPGSRLTFTYIVKDLIDGTDTHGQDGLYKKYVLDERIWVWGLDPDSVAGFLAGYGWRVVEHPTYAQLSDRYLRPKGRAVASTDVERMVYAEKM